MKEAQSLPEPQSSSMEVTQILKGLRRIVDRNTFDTDDEDALNAAIDFFAEINTLVEANKKSKRRKSTDIRREKVISRTNLVRQRKALVNHPGLTHLIQAGLLVPITIDLDSVKDLLTLDIDEIHSYPLFNYEEDGVTISHISQCLVGRKIGYGEYLNHMKDVFNPWPPKWDQIPTNERTLDQEIV